ncbi:MAG: HD domain-containing protein, partial [Spirochaetaceae bacterium]
MFTKSPKESGLDRRIIELVPEALREFAEEVLNDREIKAMQDYANVVSIKRLGYNDHGPVHMRKVCKNAVKMAGLLQEAGIKMSLEREGIGSHTDSVLALFMAGLLHDIGMSLTRQDHENYSALLAQPLLDSYLDRYYGEDTDKKVIVRSLVLEAIVGHMAAVRIHSIEAGIILIADGCDMEKGRARIPLLIQHEARAGDIHKYSSSAVDRIKIRAGSERPIAITIEMNQSVGFFQVEEVLYPKLNMSPAKEFIELYAGITGQKLKR